MEREKKELTIDIENIAIKRKIEEGIELFNLSKYVHAIEKFSMVLGSFEYGLARQYLGRCYFRLEKYEQAYNHFNKLLEDKRYRDYGLSMLATIYAIWGHYKEALKEIKKIPPKPSNLIKQLYILYYIHKHTKRDSTLSDATQIMRKITRMEMSKSLKRKFYLASGMVWQAQKENSLAESQFLKALQLAVTDLDKAKILNELGLLYLELNDLSRAENILLEVHDLLKDSNSEEKGVNYKLLGLLERKKKNLEKAQYYLQEAVKILREKETYLAAAEVNCLLMNLYKEDFYVSAEYFANVLQCEQSIEEVKKQNEKILNIIDGNFDDNTFINNDSFSRS
ncbi:MAG: hypothetical protein KAX49_02245 [Halanaerobiales bacterium]|nr:hypothetical protein [Halanaerobiales bacterium]